MKKYIAILCFLALLLSTSSVTYYYWVEEYMHEQERFTSIDQGQFKAEEDHKIKLLLADKNILPEGYTWEEEGREFSYQGMFYDIISLKQTEKGWELVAASDKEEAVIVKHQQQLQHNDLAVKNHKANKSFKVSLSKIIYDAPSFVKNDWIIFSSPLQLSFYNSHLPTIFLKVLYLPPEAI